MQLIVWRLVMSDSSRRSLICCSRIAIRFDQCEVKTCDNLTAETNHHLSMHTKTLETSFLMQTIHETHRTTSLLLTIVLLVSRLFLFEQSNRNLHKKKKNTKSGEEPIVAVYAEVHTF